MLCANAFVATIHDALACFNTFVCCPIVAVLPAVAILGSITGLPRSTAMATGLGISEAQLLLLRGC